MKVVKAYVDDSYMALLVCPHCGMSRNADVSKYKDKKGPLKIKCRCTTVYGVNLEFRRQYRKPTELPGRYVLLGSGGRSGRMVVKNVSMGGIGFMTRTTNPMQIGDQITIEFTLDDGKDSKIKRRAIVRVVEDQYVGVQFQTQAGVYDAALGFYLRR